MLTGIVHVVLVVLLVSWPAVAQAQPSCRFVLGFAEAVTTLGAWIPGDCLEDQRTTTGSETIQVAGRVFPVHPGSTLQRTTRGVFGWNPQNGHVVFLTEDGIYNGPPSALVLTTWEEFDQQQARRAAAAQPAPAPTSTPLPARQPTERNQADSICFNMFSDALIRNVRIGLDPAQVERDKAEANAINFLCSAAVEANGLKGARCFQRAWESSRGMESVFPGSGRKAYDGAYATCIAGR